MRRLTGTSPHQERDESGDVVPSEASFLPDGKALSEVPLRVLEAEARRLESLIGADKRKRRQFATLTEKIAKGKTQLETVRNDIRDAEGAQARIDKLTRKRSSDYSIERLSPGTRGIVLLLLYLAIDRDDHRPLIIDQPEENLDPKSIFEELVARFRQAKLRRQIIVVTHNANLIVNADADQVIVASCGPHNPGALPKLTYESGSLEDAHIRAKVCDILEGGEQAFRERAKRLRVEFA